MKVGFVLPRYGTEVHGGAETAARMLAERLHRVPGWAVEVFTSCALDSVGWADAYAAGTTEVEGVPVHRFPSVPKDVDDFHRRSLRVFADPSSLTLAEARDWIVRQGPVCAGAVDAAEASDCDVVTFHPYLYWPTVEGVTRLGARAVLHPATHDEPPARLAVFPPVFEGAGGVVFWTQEERALAERLFPGVVTRPQLVLGIGVERTHGDASIERAARDALGLGDRPYLLCLGKVTAMKGTGVLATMFAAYKARHPGPLTLVLAGPVHDAPVAYPDVVLAGAVDEATKWGLLEGAVALVSPSAYESLSLVVLEAWAARTPVLVNGLCDPTREHCARSGGGLWYTGYGTFEAALERLTTDARLRGALAAAGAAYVERGYRWEGVLARYRAFLTRVAARVPEHA